MKTNKVKIAATLNPIIGLKICRSMRNADVRIFEFGTKIAETDTWQSNYALHIQCSWRIEHHSKIVTGKADEALPFTIEKDFDWDSWDPAEDFTRQDILIKNLFSDTESASLFLENRTEKLLVENVSADEFGGLAIKFTGGYQLVLFPDNSINESWRFFEIDNDADHFIISQDVLD